MVTVTLKLGKDRPPDAGVCSVLAVAILFVTVGGAGGFQPTGSAKVPSTAKLTKADALEAVIHALAKSRNADAAAQLGQILRGEIDLSASAPLGAHLAATAMLSERRPEYEPILLDALLAPRESERNAPVQTTELRAIVAAVVAETAPAQFRVAMAKRLSEKGLADASRQQLVTILQQAHQENLEAQALLYCSEETPTTVKDSLETTLLAYSRAGLDKLLGVPVNKEFAEIDVGHVATALWSEKLASAAEARLSEAKQRRNVVVSLLASMPTPSARTHFTRLIDKYADEGPSELIGYPVSPVRSVPPRDSAKLGFFGQGWSDPALCLLIRSAPRRERPVAKPGERTRVIPVPKKKQSQLESAYAWMDASAHLLRVTVQRCLLAASNNLAPADDLYVVLHEDAKVIARYRMRWPAEVKAKYSGLDANHLAIDYLRAEQQGDFNKVRDYYVRQLRPITRRLEDGVWLEKLPAGSQPGLIRATDVLLTTTEKDKIVIDVLSLEIPKVR